MKPRFSDAAAGKHFHLPRRYCGIYLSAHVVDFGKRIPRTRAMKDRPWYHKYGGKQKDWTYKIFGEDA